MVELVSFIRKDKAELSASIQSGEVAQKLFTHLNTEPMLKLIGEANLPGASSSMIQNCFLEHAKELGFRDEAKGLFAGYKTSGLRPDYFMPIGDTGILFEVERGKTTINNMDILDFWKCHLCREANYLFLLVPKSLRQNPDMAPRNEYAFVAKRLSAFFDPENYTNVYGLWLFGY